jgi:hypothetical protein
MTGTPIALVTGATAGLAVAGYLWARVLARRDLNH